MKKTMKMLLSVVLIITMVAISSLFAFAESTTLTTIVPTATYTLTVPLSATVEYGDVLTLIDAPKIEASEGFGLGKNLKLTIVKEDFKCPDTSTTIPYTYEMYETSPATGEITLDENTCVYFKGTQAGTLNKFAGLNAGDKYAGARINVKAEDWPKALAGEYTSIITYVTEVVAE